MGALNVCVCYLKDDNEIDAERCRISLRNKSAITLFTLDSAGRVACLTGVVQSIKFDPKRPVGNTMARGNGYGDRRDHTSAAPKDGVLNSFDQGSTACRAGRQAADFASSRSSSTIILALIGGPRRQIHD
jgi:hypothetical protein